MYNLFFRCIADFIVAARSRVSLMRRRLAANDPFLGSDRDEEDAKSIAKAQEKVMEDITLENCVTQPDGKARCGLSWCNKLFKGQDFLMKHIKNKHPDLALVRLVRVAESYMLARFNAEDICKRPLGPIEIESSGGLEQKTVKEVYEAAKARLSDTHIQYRHDRGAGRGRGNTRRDDNRGEKRDFQSERHRENDRRFSEGNRPTRGEDVPRNERRESAPITTESVPPRNEDSNSRKLHSYVDIDSPMVRNFLKSFTSVKSEYLKWFTPQLVSNISLQRWKSRCYRIYSF